MQNNQKTYTAAILTFAKMMALIATIAIASALSRLLDKNTYGAFCQVLMVYTMSSIIVRSGLPQSVYYFLPRLDLPEQKGFIFQSIFLLTCFGLLIGGILFFGAEYIGKHWHSELLPSFLRNFALYPVFVMPIMVIESIFMSFNRVKTVFYYNIISKIITFFVVVGPIFLGYPVVFAIRCWVAYAFLQLIVLIYIVNKVVDSNGIKFSTQTFMAQFKYCLPLSVAAILGTFAAYADKISVSTLGNPELFAVYFNGAFELPIMGVVGGAVTITLFPLMTQFAKEKRFDEFFGLWYRSQTKVAFILFPMWLFFLFFASESIVLLFGKPYSQSIIIFQIFLFLIPARLCTFSRIIAPLNRNWIYTLGHLIQLVVGVISCLLLFWEFGIIGAAVGIVLSIYANIFFMGYFCSKILQVKFHQMWPLKQLGIYFLVALLSGSLAFLICLKIPASTNYFRLIRLFIGAISISTIYLVILYKLNMFNWNEWRRMLFSKPQSPVKEISVDDEVAL